MHPCRTALVGLVLFGIANAQNPQFVNGNLYAQGDIIDAAAGEAPYWWMDKASPFKRSYPSAGAINNAGQPLDIYANPFLGGNSLSSASSQQPIDISNNPFLSSGKPFSAAPTSQYADASPYAAPGYLPPDQVVSTIPCTGSDRVCVSKFVCNNGFVDNRNQASSSLQNCNAASEVCCTVRPVATPAPVTRPPIRDVPVTYRPSTFQPQPQTTPCFEKNSGCVSPDQCVNGYIANKASNSFESRAPAQKCYAPEVCCRFVDQKPASQNQVTSNYQPTARPVTSRPYSPTPSEVLTSEGYVITVPQTRFPPQPVTQTPYVTQRPYSPTTQQYYAPVTQKQTPYLPPVPQTQGPYVPQTQRPYVTPAAPTQRPFKGEGYIPPKDNHIGDSSNGNPNYLPPQHDKPLRGEEEKSEPIHVGNPSNDSPSIIRPGGPEAPAPLPPTQCPAATNCTEIQFCTAEGVISKSPVVLTRDQELFRVPLSDCRNLSPAYTGKCCRDPDYVDPWPVGILGQYNESILGFDNGQYRANPNVNNGQPKPSPINRGGSPSTPIRGVPSTPFRDQQPLTPNRGVPSTPFRDQQPATPNRGQPIAPNRAGPPAPIRGQDILSLPIGVTAQTQNQYTRTPFPQQPNLFTQRDKENNYKVEPISSQSGICAVRDRNSLPKGPGPLDAAFAEFPWQAMVLKESTKSLLCGGAIVQADTVVTAANCVQGVQPFDILIKAGEWKLGSDEEPKKFQTIRVKSISFHPDFQPNTFGSDVALLHLEISLKFDKHIGPICIDENEVEPNASTDECVTTGWGKEALKYHAANSQMHYIPVSPLSQNDCKSSLNGYNPSTSVCARPQADACQADIGSALACSSGNGKYLLKGVYATENECASPSQIITFTKMDVKWIKNTMQGPVPHQADSPQTIPRQPVYTVQPTNERVTYQTIASTQAPSYLPPRQ